MRYEHPSELLGRLRLGREEFCQRLLTMLILGGHYPRWNTENVPTPSGRRFLDGLHRRSFSDGFEVADSCVFVDEFDLPRRTDDERGGAPDYAVLAPGTLWLIELKTERTSHRHGQIPLYFELARHHHADRNVDITYLTPAMTAVYEPPGPWGRYAHTTWDTAADVIREVWAEDVDPEARIVVERLLATIAEVDTMTAREWRLSNQPQPRSPSATVPTAELTPESPPDPFARAMEIAAEVADDGRQRALDFRAADLEELQELRLQIRDALAATPPGSPHRHVMPWLWQFSSSGRPLTEIGSALGYELRLSRYAKPLY